MPDPGDKPIPFWAHGFDKRQESEQIIINFIFILQVLQKSFIRYDIAKNINNCLNHYFIYIMSNLYTIVTKSIKRKN